MPEEGLRFLADMADAGERLDRVLARRADTSRGRAQAVIADGRVHLGDRPAAKSDVVAAGDEIVVAPAPPDEPSEPPPRIAVRYEDDHLAVVAKPADLVVHAGAGTSAPTMVDALQAMGMPLAPTADPARPGIVHRLDRGTSGVLVVAKTEIARAGLLRLFARHDVERRYWALVDGVPDPPSATIDAPIARDPARRTRFRVDPGGRVARSHYDVEDALGRAAVVAVRLETGRTHQVRVHLSAVGHPVCGDRTYGADAATAALTGLLRPALHAARLAFAHPVTGATVAVDEPLPADLVEALVRIREARERG